MVWSMSKLQVLVLRRLQAVRSDGRHLWYLTGVDVGLSDGIVARCLSLSVGWYALRVLSHGLAWSDPMVGQRSWCPDVSVPGTVRGWLERRVPRHGRLR